MRNLEEYYEKAKKIVEEAGFEVPENMELEPITNKHVYGLSLGNAKTGHYKIQIDKVFLHEEIPEYGLMSVLIHEIAHTVTAIKYKEYGHTAKWRYVLRRILEKHPEYDDHSADDPNGIGSSKLCGLTPKNLYKAGYKDICYCPSCGAIWFQKRSNSKVLEKAVGLPCTNCGTFDRFLFKNRNKAPFLPFFRFRQATDKIQNKLGKNNIAAAPIYKCIGAAAIWLCARRRTFLTGVSPESAR